MRRGVDRGAPPGRFLLTGSATPVAGIDTHSGAGRILSVRMRPMALHEREGFEPVVGLGDLLEARAGDLGGTTPVVAHDYYRAIESSGLPGLQGMPERYARAQLDGYLQRVIDRDLPDRGVVVRRPETLRRWLTADAAASSTPTTHERILQGAAARGGNPPAKTTGIAYRDHLTQLWLLDPVPGWSPSRSALARLQQAPKHQLAYPALAARLLHVSAASMTDGTGEHMAGPLFESLATLSVRVAAQAAGARVGHLRTRNGDHEVDLVVEGSDGRVLGIEVKLAAAVTDADVCHLLWLRDRLPEDVVDLMVLTTGARAHRRNDGVAVVPLSVLGA